MITKAEATALFNTFNSPATFSARVEAQIRAAAQSGLTSVTIAWGNVSNATAAAVGTELTNAGWTVVSDGVARTSTIS